MPQVEYAVFDADNHYYEAEDAFTRHLDPRLGPRTVQWAEIDGRRYHVVGGKVSRAVTNPTFNPIAKPGAMCEYFRGNPSGRNPIEFLRDREPIRAEYLDHDARLQALDAQGLEAIWLFPTLGVLYEELLKHDPEAVMTTFRAFNEWLHEDWGFDYQRKIFAAPYISLAMLDRAVAELDWALERGARIICIRPAAVYSTTGSLAPSDPTFDPFWARVNEAGITVIVHAGDSGYSSQGYAEDRFGANFAGGFRPSVKTWAIERACQDFLATLMFDKLFERFPNLRVAAIENGSDYLPDLFKKLDSSAKRMTGYYAEHPTELFKRHVWINPFWEDDVREVVDLMGADRVIFGSDWPHIEGMPEPRDYLHELEGFSADDIQRIMRDNARELNTPKPA